MKTPPYGKQIAERLRFRNDPDHLVVCIGMDNWRRAKEWNNAPNDCPAMVQPADTDPRGYVWPVRDQLVVIDVAAGPTDEQVRDLAVVLLEYGAETVTVYSRDRLNRFAQYRARIQEAA